MSECLKHKYSGGPECPECIIEGSDAWMNIAINQTGVITRIRTITNCPEETPLEGWVWGIMEDIDGLLELAYDAIECEMSQDELRDRLEKYRGKYEEQTK